jgi:ABC-2 type transport system ATP-binding protein
MVVVATQKLNKSFGKLIAVRDLTLDINDGEIFGLLGPNGSGKTTLMRMMVGLVKPTSGSATVLGHPVSEKAHLAQLGYMTQAGALYSDLTVRENCEFFAAMGGGASKERVNEVLALVELTDRANSVVGILSGGLKQRVSLACALVHQPRLLILDEPTVGVDPALRASFWRYFRELAGQGVTIIVSSHAMDEAERCDRLAFMRNGSLLAVGTPREVVSGAHAANLEEAFLAYASGHNGQTGVTA